MSRFALVHFGEFRVRGEGNPGLPAVFSPDFVRGKCELDMASASGLRIDVSVGLR